MTPMAPDKLQQLLEILDEQCEDYQSMYREGVAQRDCLRDDDLRGLNASTGRMRALMDSVRARHTRLPVELIRLEREQPEVAERTECLRHTIQSVLDLRDQSERAARGLLGETRRQVRQVRTGRRASRGYGRPPAAQESRFVDNLR